MRGFRKYRINNQTKNEFDATTLLTALLISVQSRARTSDAFEAGIGQHENTRGFQIDTSYLDKCKNSKSFIKNNIVRAYRPAFACY